MDRRCKYKGVRCENARARRENGEFHRLCEPHRQRANANQRRYQERRDEERASGAITMPPPPEMPSAERDIYKMPSAERDIYYRYRYVDDEEEDDDDDERPIRLRALAEAAAASGRIFQARDRQEPGQR